MKRNSLAPILAVLALALAAPACAQVIRPDSRYGYGSDVRRIAYERGYHEGAAEGERDGRSRDAFEYRDERDFRRADIGYDRRYGDFERYRAHFRSGFADGYTEGYGRYARGGDGRGGYGGGYGGDYGGGYGGGYSQERLTPFDIGARDGFEKGREDARDGDRPNPRLHKWYRDGDREYDSRYGSRDRYKNEYRRGFIAGYEQGYRAR